MLIPDELNDDLREILGQPPWTTGTIARAMREAGADIKPKMEAEQAHVMHWLLKLYAEHGKGWRQAAGNGIADIQQQLQVKDAARVGCRDAGAPIGHLGECPTCEAASGERCRGPLA